MLLLDLRKSNGPLYRRVYRRTAREALGYADPAGYAPLRAALAEYLKRARGVVCEAEQIVITNTTRSL